MTISPLSLSPAIYGNKIVWSAFGNDNYHDDIYMYDLSTKKETQITNNVYYSAYAPDIYGNKIIYELVDDEGYGDIYVHDLSTKEETSLSTTGTADNPHIYGNKIVWDDNLASLEDPNTNGNIYMYDLSTKKETQITSSPDYQTHPAIYGNRIVWEDDGGQDDGWVNHGIYMYDISTNQKMKISAKGSAYHPATYGDRVVWQYGEEYSGDTDIYMATVEVPQPKPPVAAFSASPRSGKVPLKVQFTDKSSNSPTSWKWSFGDRTYSTAKNPVHKYSKAGKYTVSLAVKNAKGSNTKTVSGYIVAKK